jgi:casein kinase II subunit alpha
MSAKGRSKPRVYAEVNNQKEKEYWDYETHVIEWG